MSCIAIDVRMLNASGIGTYIQRLIPGVIEEMPEHSFYLLGNREELLKCNWTQKQNIKIVQFDSPIYSISEQFVFRKIIPKDTALFWSPHYNIPLLYRGKLLVTVHDVLHLAMPEFFHGIHKKIYSKGMFQVLKRKASCIIFNSNFTASEFQNFVGTSKASCKVIHLGVDDFWKPVENKVSPHPNPYLLYVGNVKPHKNLKSLVKSFELIANDIPHDLIIVGKKEGFITSDLESIEEAKQLGGRVLFTGHISNDLLREYYSSATALVFPSLYEGFGLPPLEAMACGCPTIVSTFGSVPEICGDASLYINPESPEDISNKIKKLINKLQIQNQLREKGFQRVKQFTWEVTTEKTISLINETL